MEEQRERIDIMREHNKIPIETLNTVEEIVFSKTLELVKQGYSIDSIEIYFNKAIQIGIYKAEVEIAMK